MARRTRADDRLAPLTGRSRELDHLKGALHEAATGKGRVVAIYGEAGVGKTRLLEELSSYAESCGITVLSAYCPDDPGTPPYWPWSQVLSVVTSAMEQPLLSETLGPNAALAAEAFPAIRTALPQALPIRSSSDTADSARFRLFDAVTRLLAACARTGPLLLLLDDLHWADEASLKLLVHLCGEIGRMPILLTGTYRDLGFDPGHPLPAAVGALGRQRWFSRLPLHGLSEAEATDLIVKGMGEGAAQSHAGTIYRLTDGNPLFLTQIIRLLAGDPAAADAPGGLTVGVREVIALRLSRLSCECNEAITMASVLGTEFAASLLAEAIGPASGPGVVAALDEAVKERLIEETEEQPDRYRFSHALIRDAVLAGLPPGRRAQLHARVYGILTNRGQGNGTGHAAELLGHALQGQVVLGPEAAAGPRCG